MEHVEQRHNVAEMTEHKVIRTVEHILDKADGELTIDELEKLCYCWKIINHIYGGMMYAKNVNSRG